MRFEVAGEAGVMVEPPQRGGRQQQKSGAFATSRLEAADRVGVVT